MITDERTAAFIESLDTDLPLYLSEIEKEAILDHVPIIKKPTQGLVRFLIRHQKPEEILEVGTAVGFSALLMNMYQPAGGTVTTIEKVPKRILKARENIDKAGKGEHIHLMEGEALSILNELIDSGRKFDLVFMDAAKGQYLNFLPLVLKLLVKGGMLVSDNVLQDGEIVESRYAVTRRNRTIHGRMREYLFQLTHHEELDTIILPIGDGVTLSTLLEG